MKNLVYLMLLSASVSFAQQQPVAQSTASKLFFSKLFGGKKNKSVLKPFQYKAQNNADFTIYNPTTGLNDNYTLYNDEYKASLSKPVMVNEYSPKIDSFNPSGSDTIGGALFVGFFNFLFGKD